MKNIKNKTKSWLLNRRSADDTTNRGSWILIGLVLVLVVGGIMVGAATDGFTNLADLFTNTTEGNQTNAPGSWNNGG